MERKQSTNHATMNEISWNYNVKKQCCAKIIAFCVINLALFVDYKGEYSKIVEHMKMDDAFNFGMYKQLHPSLTYEDYILCSTRIGFMMNIGNYDRQYRYAETKFCDFDKFLFTSWRNKSNGKGKDLIPWGVPVN